MARCSPERKDPAEDQLAYIGPSSLVTGNQLLVMKWVFRILFPLRSRSEVRGQVEIQRRCWGDKCLKCLTCSGQRRNALEFRIPLRKRGSSHGSSRRTTWHFSGLCLFLRSTCDLGAQSQEPRALSLQEQGIYPGVRLGIRCKDLVRSLLTKEDTYRC